jgi:hypothetical protein
MRSVKESTLRARARELGYAIHKSRSRSIGEDNLGRYALVEDDGNRVVLGERFDASWGLIGLSVFLVGARRRLFEFGNR